MRRPPSRWTFAITPTRAMSSSGWRACTRDRPLTFVPPAAALRPCTSERRTRLRSAAVTESQTSLRRVVLGVALLNLGYFFVEFGVARVIGSVSLFADSIDFLEDASVNLLILVALGWTARRRAAMGSFLALLLLVPGIATAWMAWSKFQQPVPPAELP